MMRRTGILIATLSILILCSSWGFLAHKTSHQLAIYMLPKEMCSFFYSNIDYLEYNSVRPDVRRNTDSTEATKHFIDLEAYAPDSGASMPLKWSDAVKKYSKDTLLKYGYVPYWVVEMQSRLTNAFKQGNTDSILFYAADLGHYVEDAMVPLHTTINYDGQLTKQDGLHALWETVVPEIEISNYNLSSKHRATYIKNKSATIWQQVRKAHAMLPDIFAKEKEVTAHFTDSTKYRIQMRNGKPVKYYTTAFAQAYSKALGNTINEQMVASAKMVANFWYTAWVDAGKPDLATLPKSKLTDAQKKQLKTELLSFKNNTLFKDGFLRSKSDKK